MMWALAMPTLSSDFPSHSQPVKLAWRMSHGTTSKAPGRELVRLLRTGALAVSEHHVEAFTGIQARSASRRTGSSV